MNLPYEMALGNYRGGNDAWGTFAQRGATAEGAGPVQDAINPPLLEVRVTTPFTRRDGTRAETGEPLLKTRFPLARLAWLTHRGPSAELPVGDQLYNAEGTPAAIRECFGLEWTRDMGLAYQLTDAPGPPAEQLGYFFWKYDHSPANGRVRSEGIARLSSVADAGREPDFFELLKAGILVGSLGKAAAKNHAGMEGWAHDPASFGQLRDKDPTHQILEIGANILDQSDADSLPTLIKIGTYNTAAPGGTAFVPTFTARGIENLPYLHRLHWRAVPNANDPPSRPSDKVTEITSILASFVEEGFHCGTTSLLAFPELWNPHLPPSQPAHTTLKLRMVAVAEDPEGPTGPDSQLRPLFALLGTRWKTLLFGGAPDDRHAHFTAWPGGAFAFPLSTPGKSTKVFFHDRRFSSSYEFFGTTAMADDQHSGRLATLNPAEPSSYLFWEGMPPGDSATKYAVEGFAYWRLAADGFAPLGPGVHPANAQPPGSWRGASYSVSSHTWGAGGRPVWFAPADGRVPGRTVVEGPPSTDPSAPPAPVLELRNSELTFEMPLSQTGLFREPTSLCRRGLPSGSAADFGADNFFRGAPYHGSLRGPDGEQWLGFSLGEVPGQFIAAQRLVSAPKTTLLGTPERVDSTGALSPAGTLWRFFQVPVNLAVQRNWCLLTLRLQYQEPLSAKWITYDEKFVGMDGRMVPDQPPYQGQWNAVPVEGRGSGLGWAVPALGWVDPRTPRFGAFERYAYNWSNAVWPQGGSPARAPTLPASPTGAGRTDRPTRGGCRARRRTRPLQPGLDALQGGPRAGSKCTCRPVSKHHRLVGCPLEGTAPFTQRQRLRLDLALWKPARLLGQRSRRCPRVRPLLGGLQPRRGRAGIHRNRQMAVLGGFLPAGLAFRKHRPGPNQRRASGVCRSGRHHSPRLGRLRCHQRLCQRAGRPSSGPNAGNGKPEQARGAGPPVSLGGRVGVCVPGSAVETAGFFLP